MRHSVDFFILCATGTCCEAVAHLVSAGVLKNDLTVDVALITIWPTSMLIRPFHHQLRSGIVVHLGTPRITSFAIILREREREPYSVWFVVRMCGYFSCPGEERLYVPAYRTFCCCCGGFGSLHSGGCCCHEDCACRHHLRCLPRTKQQR